MRKPDRESLTRALTRAGEMHHEYQTVFLEGENDEQWAGWYAAYILGRLGSFTTPSQMTNWLAEVPVTDNWTAEAADVILSNLKEQIKKS